MMTTNKMSFGLRKDFLGLVLATLLALIPEYHLNDVSDQGVHLEYICLTPNTPPEKEEPPVIFLHGLTDMKDAWDCIYPNTPHLDRRTVCAYDARDHGYSGWDDTFNVDAMAEDLRRFMDDRKIEKAILVGHSMGGLTAMRFVLKNPNRVIKMLLEDITVNVRDEVSEFMFGYLTLLEKCLSAIPKDADEETAKKAVAEQFAKETSLPSKKPLFKTFALRLVNGCWEWRMNNKVFIEAFKDPASWYGQCEGQYNGTVLLLYGTKSPLKVAEDKEAMVKLFPNIKYFPIEGAEHVIHCDNEEFDTKVMEFLE